MRKLILKVQEDVAAFVEQREDFVLLAGGGDGEAAVLLKILRDLEDASGTDLFLLFADPFTNLESFATDTIERLRAEHCLANEAARKEGDPPLPPFPEPLADESHPPLRRLLEAIRFARSLLPPGDHHLVWAMVPSSIEDTLGWRELTAALLPAERRIEPWMRRLRLILREVGDADTLQGVPLGRRLELDFGPEALEGSLEDEAVDESLPMPQRIQALLSLAYLDFAHKRYDLAMEKFGILLGYYQSTDDKPMQAMVLNGYGDIYHREGEFERARDWYEKASMPAMEGDSPVVFFTVTENLASVAYKQQEYAEAELLYDSAEKIATQALDAEGKARMLVWRGLSQEAQEKYAEARKSWEDSATLCRNVTLDAQLDEALSHLERLYSQARMRREEEAVRAERAQVRSQLGRGGA